MTWDPRAFLGGGGFQPGGIMGGPGQGGQVNMPTLPGAANGGAPPPGTGTAPLPWMRGAGGGFPHAGPMGQGVANGFGHFGQGLHDILGGLRNARVDFRDGIMSRLGQLPSLVGMQPRPGGTAGGGWQFPGGLQMPQGFAAQLPWGQGAAPGGGPRPMGPGHREPDAEPDADADDTRGGWGMMNRGAADSINRMAAQNNAAGSGGQARGNYVPKDPAAASETKRKGEEIGKKAKGY